ncbi:hypothetical protein M426DRAFT_325623 [Hypoxylon sp. CI-4A]|nr:hypothetical protein M426DRAFT_325623 [Hypoxylon sp. CI-4A]
MESRPDFQFRQLESDTDSDDDSNPDFSGLSYSDPATLSSIFGAKVEYQSPASVRREAKERSDKIFDNYKLLQEIILRHEATIRRRWVKKTKQQKLKILLTAWPNMAASHRPDFEAFRKESGRLPNVQTHYREHFIWPYINQEDLSQPKALLLLLNARGRHHPSEFAAIDMDSIHLGRVTKAIIPIFLNEYVMKLNGISDDREYGELIAWEDHPDAFDWMHTQKQFIPGEGLVILEAQERILTFLVDCCKQILHDIPAETLTTDAFPVQPEPTLQSEGEAGGFSSLTIMAAEAPYRVPAHLNLDRIESLLDARTAAAEDHIWALREDPSFFADTLLETKEHRSEIIKDSRGQIHPTLKPGRERLFWARVIGNVVLNSYIQLEVFAELRQQARDLKRLQQKYQAEISPMEDLPEEYLFAILKFMHYLNRAAKGPMDLLKKDVPASPPMRRFFTRQPPEDIASSKISVHTRPDVQRVGVEGNLFWLLTTLWEDDYALFLTRMPLVLDELGRLLHTEKSASDLISAHIAAIISDLSILTQCINQLNLYLPWARTFENAMLTHETAIQLDFEKTVAPWAKLMAAFEDTHLNYVAILGNPSDKKFFYPVEKRRTKENVEALRRAEHSLDKLWAEMDRLMYDKCGKLDGTALQSLLSRSRVLQRTPEWVDKPPSTAQKPGGKLEVQPAIDTLYQPLSALYISRTALKNEEKPKIKEKTRKTPQPSESVSDAVDIKVEANQPQNLIPVDAKSLKVFRTLFFNPEVTSTPGEVAWSDFLHAMTTTGLFSAEKLYGSVWQFQRADGLGRIQFHEPHPRGKIPFTIARRHGRRLSRAFGWVGEMFQLRQKGDA